MIFWTAARWPCATRWDFTFVACYWPAVAAADGTEGEPYLVSEIALPWLAADAL